MGAGLGSVSAGKTVYLVIRFTGEITKDDADGLNEKLNQLLKDLHEGVGGGTGKVSANNAVEVTSKF